MNHLPQLRFFGRCDLLVLFRPVFARVILPNRSIKAALLGAEKPIWILLEVRTDHAGNGYALKLRADNAPRPDSRVRIEIPLDAVRGLGLDATSVPDSS